MITIYDQKKVNIRWEVFKSVNNVHEDFSQAEVWMFLIADEHKYPLHTALDGNFVTATIDGGAFAPGSYSAVLMWLKNPETSKDLTRTRLDNIFALTPYEDEDTSRVEGDVTVTLKSMVATYGYDGLDAYERAIMLGRFWGSEEEWMQSLGDHDLANYYTKGEVDELIDNVEVDLSDYYTKEQTATKINEAAGRLHDEVEENTDAINDVSQRVSTNAQGIADNTDAITENTEDINQLKSGMTTMGGRVSELETEMENFVGLNQSNYMGMFPDVNSLPAMTEKGWAWVGSDMTAMAAYVWFNATDGWTRYGSNTYDLTDYTQVATLVAQIISQLGDLESEVAFIGEDEGTEGGTADFTPYADTVWNKAQTLSSAQKAQARANIGAVSNEEVAQQMRVVNSKIDSIEPINLINNGTITNLADEEDITSENNLLKLKDRYNYVILRSNKTFASQVTKADTIYEIRYDFDLDGESVTIPSGCTLDFKGGIIKNGTLVGNNTRIESVIKQIFDSTTNTSGSWSNENGYPEWFGASSDGVSDDAPFILKSIKTFAKTVLTSVYTIASEMDMSNLSNKCIVGTGGCMLNGVTGNYTTFFAGTNVSNITFQNIKFDGKRPQSDISWEWPHKMNAAIIFRENSNNVTIADCQFANLWYGVCPCTRSSENARVERNYFYNCNTDIDCYSCPSLLILENVSKGCTAYSIQIESFKIEGDIEDYNDYKSNPIAVCTQIINNVITDSKGFAIIAHGGSYNAIISGNNIYNYEVGVYVKEGSYGTVVSNNIIKNCTAQENSDSDSRPYADSNAIRIEGEGVSVKNNYIVFAETGIGTKGAKNVEIVGNTIRNSRHSGISIRASAEGMTLEDNVIDGVCISNNGWWGQCAVYLDSLSENLTIFNFKINGTNGTSSSSHAIYINRSTGIINVDCCEITNVVKTVQSSTTNYVVTNRMKSYGIGKTGERPDGTTIEQGFMYFDTTLGKMIVWNGTAWVNMDGSALS